MTYDLLYMISLCIMKITWIRIEFSEGSVGRLTEILSHPFSLCFRYKFIKHEELEHIFEARSCFLARLDYTGSRVMYFIVLESNLAYVSV